jgi:Helix-turn-helix domain of resolvase
MSGQNQPDAVQFYQDMIQELQIALQIIQNLQTAGEETVERSVFKLKAMQTTLIHLDDPTLDDATRMEMMEDVNNVLTSLESFLASLPHPEIHNQQQHYTGRPGRPVYNLDLNRVLELHDLGISFAEIAEIFQVARKTLYNHLEKAGLSSARPPPAMISEEDLDAHVKTILEEHPFIGSTIIQGHLLTMELRVPLRWIKQSLLRVDPLGVMSRWERLTMRVLVQQFT